MVKEIRVTIISIINHLKDDNETEVEIVPKTIVKDTTNDETVSTGLHVG